MAAGIESDYAAKLIASPNADDQVMLQASILLELRELNARLARAEVVGTGLLQGKGAKWVALFAKASGFGDGR